MEKELDRDYPLKKEISENIKSLMKQRGWKQKDLSEKSGISKSTLSDYLNCKTLINVGNVEKVAEVFGVTKATIDPSFKSPFIGPENFSITTFQDYKEFLPLYGEVYCGEGEVHYGYPIDEIETPSEWLIGGEYFYLIAKGDSMVGARIHENDLLLIRKQPIVENGEIAVVIVDDKRMLKRVYKTDDTFTLVSENPMYPPITYKPGANENIRILGKLKKSITNF